MKGNEGDDTLTGGGGADNLTGGAGANDVFTSNGADTITDFVNNGDQLNLDAIVADNDGGIEVLLQRRASVIFNYR